MSKFVQTKMKNFNGILAKCMQNFMGNPNLASDLQNFGILTSQCQKVPCGSKLRFLTGFWLHFKGYLNSYVIIMIQNVH